MGLYVGIINYRKYVLFHSNSYKSILFFSLNSGKLDFIQKKKKLFYFFYFTVKSLYFSNNSFFFFVKYDSPENKFAEMVDNET